MFLKHIDHVVQVRIACAKLPHEPVSASSDDRLVVDEHVELAGLAGLEDRVDVEVLLDEGRETRGLSSVVLSSRAVTDRDLHLHQ